MKFVTKQKRLVAIFDAYLKRFDKTAATMEAVSQWAIEQKLYPVPTRHDSEEDGLAWEKKLDEATTVGSR